MTRAHCSLCGREVDINDLGEVAEHDRVYDGGRRTHCEGSGQLAAEHSVLISRRIYLVIKAMDAGASMFMAREIVATFAIEHPELDMIEMKTWGEWELCQ